MIFVCLCFIIDRKLRINRTIRVPFRSNKLADIPPDEYTWRKYGQKPIKGSPYPRYITVPIPCSASSQLEYIWPICSSSIPFSYLFIFSKLGAIINAAVSGDALQESMWREVWRIQTCYSLHMRGNIATPEFYFKHLPI